MKDKPTPFELTIITVTLVMMLIGALIKVGGIVPANMDDLHKAGEHDSPTDFAAHGNPGHLVHLPWIEYCEISD